MGSNIATYYETFAAAEIRFRTRAVVDASLGSNLASHVYCKELPADHWARIDTEDMCVLCAHYVQGYIFEGASDRIANKLGKDPNADAKDVVPYS